MPNIFDGFLQQVARGDNIKDYQHAARIFVDNNFERSPKYTWLFHVYFELNPAYSALSRDEQIVAGILVKSADLPRFKVDSKTLNNYNRPSIVQTKVRYEDINLTFHDDSADIIRKLWFDYYNFYYRDMDNNYGDATGGLNEIYFYPNKQVLGRRAPLNKFGYSPRVNTDTNQYIKAIRIYSLHQKRFTEYTILNPVITAFAHGTHQNGQDGTMEHSMTLSYETVLYATGRTKIARGFANLLYDKSPSPLTPAGGGTNSILGPGGIVNVLDDVIQDGSGGNWGGAAFKLIRGYEKNKNVDLMNLAKGELTQAFTNILRNSSSTGQVSFGAAFNQTYVPYKGANQGSAFQSALPVNTTAAPGSVNSNGLNITAAAASVTGGIKTALSSFPTVDIGSKISGVFADAQGLIKGVDVNKIVDVAKGAGDTLTASVSELIPINSWQESLAAVNEKTKSLASAENTKALQESLGKATSFFTGPNAQNLVTSFQTGTNQLVQQVGSLANTPLAKFQFPAVPQVVNNLTSGYFTASGPNGYIGNTSTNAAQST
jgi:hypothetical protein